MKNKQNLLHCKKTFIYIDIFCLHVAFPNVPYTYIYGSFLTVLLKTTRAKENGNFSLCFVFLQLENPRKLTLNFLNLFPSKI